MKLSVEACAEIVDIVREAVEGIMRGDPRDVSERVRGLDLEVVSVGDSLRLQLSPQLLAKYGK